MNKVILIIGILFQISANLVAQVAKTSIVEHFTNTSCSVCGNNNSSIYNSINSNPGVLHISFHPSSPYTSDFFNQQNQSENDVRTHFYGIFGSTPRTVLNGVPIAYNTLGASLPTLVNEISNFLLTIKQTKIAGTDSFNVEVKIKKVAQDTLLNALLFIGVSEDTVMQPANNGEVNHYNVFRKALTNSMGNALLLPTSVGDSLDLFFAYLAGASWQANKLHTIGILQQNNNALINSAKSVNMTSNTVGIEIFGDAQFVNLTFPNPAKDVLNVYKPLTNLSVYDVNGRLIAAYHNLQKEEVLDISNLNIGVYYLINSEDNQRNIQKLIIQ